MHKETYLPTEALRPYVKTFLVIESDSDGMVNRILPDTSMVMAFTFKGSIAVGGSEDIIPKAAITGLRRSARLLNYGSNTGNVLVLFKEGGAAAFFKESMHLFFGNSLALDDAMNSRCVTETRERLAHAKNNMQRVAIVEQLLLSKLIADRPNKIVQAAVQQIKQAKGNLSIKSLALGLFTSTDALEKNFRSITGSTPKQFAATVRFRQLIADYNPAQSLTQLAYDAGYFDQSHFIKDFRSFTGQSPRDFFSTPVFW